MPKKILKGTVVSLLHNSEKGSEASNKMNNTVVVSIATTKRHEMYKKLIKRTKNFKARDDMGAQVGDMVTIEECKPFSKTVTWKVVEKVTGGYK